MILILILMAVEDCNSTVDTSYVHGNQVACQNLTN